MLNNLPISATIQMNIQMEEAKRERARRRIRQILINQNQWQENDERANRLSWQLMDRGIFSFAREFMGNQMNQIDQSMMRTIQRKISQNITTLSLDEQVYFYAGASFEVYFIYEFINKEVAHTQFLQRRITSKQLQSFLNGARIQDLRYYVESLDKQIKGQNSEYAWNQQDIDQLIHLITKSLPFRKLIDLWHSHLVVSDPDSITTAMSCQFKRIRIGLLGNSNSGKSSIIVQYTEKVFKPQIATAGLDYVITAQLRDIKASNSKIKRQRYKFEITLGSKGLMPYQICTTGKYHSYPRGVHAFIIVYDVTNRQSFDGVESWLRAIDQLTESHTFKILVGTKNDLGNQSVPFQQGHQFALSKRIQFKEVSAKRSNEIREIFDTIVQNVYSYLCQNPFERSAITIRSNISQPQRRSNCC